MSYGHIIVATVLTLGVCQGHSSIASFFYTDKRVARSSAIAELFVGTDIAE